MLQSYLVWSTIILSLLPRTVVAFSPNNQLLRSTTTTTTTTTTERQAGAVVTTNNNEVKVEDDVAVDRNRNEVSRRNVISTVLTATSLISLNTAARAEDAEPEVPSVAKAPSSYSIKKCPTPSTGPCVSTSNVRQLDLYMAPWTFYDDKISPDEVMSRLKGAIVADPACEIIEQDSNMYLKVQAKRSDLFGSIDEIEFIINPTDQVVTFRSAANNDKTDLGSNKRRLEEIRKRTGIFGIMGESLDSADSKTNGEKGYGPLGQLKAFYGLQSGAGYEDVLLK